MSDDEDLRERRRLLNQRVHEMCRARGWNFKPWLPAPYLVSCDPEPPAWAKGAWRALWPKAAALRKQLLEELGEQEV